MRLAGVISRVILMGAIGCVGLVLMVLFVEHQPDSQGGMMYMNVYAAPMMALVCGLFSAMAVKDYLDPETESEV